MTEKTITLELTEEQANIVSRACEVWSRLLTGQFWIVDQKLPQFNKQENESFDITMQKRDDFRAIMDCARKLAFKWEYGVGYSRESDIAFNTYQVLRHELGDKRSPWDVTSVGMPKVLKTEGE